MRPRGANALLLFALFSLFRALDLAANEPLGLIPGSAFGEGSPAFEVGTVNDSVAIGPGWHEWNDYRSFGFRFHVGQAPFALVVALDSVTFRGAAPDPALRIDELVAGAGFTLPQVEATALTAVGRFGVGIRLWGNLGQAWIQEAWHGLLGTKREFPREYLDPVAPAGLFWATVDARLEGEADVEGSLSILLIVPGAFEGSASLRAALDSSFSTNYVYVRREERLGAPSLPDARLAAVEAGTWLGWGAASGFLSFENMLNLDAPFASCTVSLRSPPPHGPVKAPPQELTIGTNVLEPGFAVSRLLVLSGFPEIHAGIEQRAGITRLGLPRGEDCHFQEGNLVLEVFPRRRGESRALTPFAGLALGARSDAWYLRSVNQVEPIGRSLVATARCAIGLRLDSAFLGLPHGFRTAVDLIAGWLVTAREFPPAQLQLSLRGAVLDY